MKHTARNNFFPFFRGYPWTTNVPASCDRPTTAQEAEGVIDAAVHQIEAMQMSNPFDPEHYGFVPANLAYPDGDTYAMMNDMVACTITRGVDLPANYWRANVRVSKIHTGHEPFLESKNVHLCLFLPNDFAARIVLTSLGIVRRADLNENGKGCDADKDLDGICPLCENMGGCTAVKERPAVSEIDLP